MSLPPAKKSKKENNYSEQNEDVQPPTVHQQVCTVYTQLTIALANVIDDNCHIHKLLNICA